MSSTENQDSTLKVRPAYDSKENGVVLPQSVNHSAAIPGVGIEDGQISRKKKNSDISSEHPYNFKLERYDSFMVESESEGVNQTLNSTVIRKYIKPAGQDDEGPNEEFREILWQHRKRIRKQALSDYLGV